MLMTAEEHYAYVESRVSEVSRFECTDDTTFSTATAAYIYQAYLDSNSSNTFVEYLRIIEERENWV